MRIAALSDAMKYNEGLDLVISALEDEFEKVSIAAFKILRNRQENKVKQAILNFNPWLYLKCQYELKQHSKPIFCVAICDNGKKIISGGEDRQIIFYNIETEQVIYKIKENNAIVTIAISPDEKKIISRGGSNFSRRFSSVYNITNCFKIWNLHSGKLEDIIDEPSCSILSLAISSDSKTLAYGLSNNSIVITDFSEKIVEKQRIKHPKCLPNFLAINVDRNIVVSSGNTGEVRFWDIETGKRRQIFKEHSAEVNCVAISPDGQTLVSGSVDETVKIWNLDNKQAKYTLVGHSGGIYDVKISPDGQTLFSAGRDKTIKIWNLKTGELLNTLTGHSDWIYSLAISSDGSTLVSGSRDNTIRVWRV